MPAEIMKLLSTVGSRVLNAIRYYCVEWARSSRLLRMSGLRIMSPLETIEQIRRTGCSVSRFGDGEFVLSIKGSIGFQKTSTELQKEITSVLSSPPPNLLVCIPYCFTTDGMRQLTSKDARGWRRFAIEYLPLIIQLTSRHESRAGGVVYGDSLMSRPYMIYKKRVEHAGPVFEALKGLWHGREVLIVEGESTRLGVGNDLFSSVKKIRRILCPAFDAYARIGEIESKVLYHANGALVLLALGPTATVLASRLVKHGLQAIDVGHVDVEYQWFKMRSKHKVPIIGKYVHEAENGDVHVQECNDAGYIASIVDAVL